MPRSAKEAFSLERSPRSEARSKFPKNQICQVELPDQGESESLNQQDQIESLPSPRSVIRQPRIAYDFNLTPSPKGLRFRDLCWDEDHIRNNSNTDRSDAHKFQDHIQRTSDRTNQQTTPLRDKQQDRLLSTPIQQRSRAQSFSPLNKSLKSNFVPAPIQSVGMRQLSETIIKVVRQQKSCTYKNVADDLVQKIKDQGSPYSFKEEKNLRRRTYDILNVMSAAGIIFREGRQIFRANQTKKQQPEREKLRELIKAKEYLLSERKKQLATVTIRQERAQMLLRRNKKIQPGTKFYFPLIGVTYESSEKVEWKFTKTKFHFVSQQQPPIYGDLNLIELLKG